MPRPAASASAAARNAGRRTHARPARRASLRIPPPRPTTLEGVILGIDTSLGTAVAVADLDGVVHAEASSANPLGHAEVIGELLQQALAAAAHGPIGATSAPAPVAITHVAVGMGPGPFTGLRVGIAAARAFALGRGLPVVPVPSHDAIALGLLLADALADPFDDADVADAADDADAADPAAPASNAPLAVVTDARRREFAVSVYDGLDDDGLPHRIAGPLLTPRDQTDSVLAPWGARREGAASVPATMIALLAARALAAGRTLTGSEPLYLRAPDVTLPAPRKKVGA